MKKDLDTLVAMVVKAGGQQGVAARRRLSTEVAAKDAAKGLFGLEGDLLGDGRVLGALGRMWRPSRSHGRGRSSAVAWGKRQELIGAAVKCQQVEGAEIVARGVKLGDAEADKLDQSRIGPKADPSAVGGEGQAEVEQLGWRIQPLQKAVGQ